MHIMFPFETIYFIYFLRMSVTKGTAKMICLTDQHALYSTHELDFSLKYDQCFSFSLCFSPFTAPIQQTQRPAKHIPGIFVILSTI